MTPSHADVIIIGGGPAGCAAGISCAQNGLTVLMIAGKDAHDTSEIGPAESVHPGIETLLTELNAAHCIHVASRGVYDKILVNSDYNYLGADKQEIWQGHHIDRKLFDEALLSCTTQQGVILVADDAVEDIIINSGLPSEIATKTGRNFTCTWLIDASGHKSVVGKKLGFKEEFYSSPLIVWTGISANISANYSLLEKNTARFIPHANGWTWLAPESSGSCTWTKLRVKGKQDFSPPEELDGSPLI
ncbi:MAG TPA: tryptophan 7-halogenase, partial [Chitinophagaceae bacterium]